MAHDIQTAGIDSLSRPAAGPSGSPDRSPAASAPAPSDPPDASPSHAHPIPDRAAVNAAIERIVLTHADLVLRLAYARLGSRADAQDVCQTVLLRLLRASQAGSVRFRDAEHEKAWVIRATINACIDERRGGGDGRVVSLDALRQERGWEAAQDDTDPLDDATASEPWEPGDPAEADELGRPAITDGLGSPNDLGPQEVLAAVNALPPAYRQAVYLRYYEGYSTREIAELTGEHAATVRKRLSRAHAQLRDLLEGGAR